MFDASNFPTDFGQWTHEQRVQKSYLSEEKVQLLNCLQFDWAAPSRSPSVPWHVMYQELMHYLKRIAPHTRQFDGTPNTKLIQKNGASEHLIAWSKTQQARYRRVQEKKKNGDDVTANGFRGMPTWQIQLLRDVNFDFDTTLETQWMEKYHLLAAYIKEHGNMKVKRDVSPCRNIVCSTVLYTVTISILLLCVRYASDIWIHIRLFCCRLFCHFVRFFKYLRVSNI